ncbi:MAG: tripartite tricarboxylate transporter substrate binding protein [Geminicoccaceae bacterium]
MSLFRPWRGVALAVALAAFSGPAFAIDELTIIAPANPGGGWDQTARALQSSMQEAGIVKSATVENIGGAGGTVGLAQFVAKEKGEGDALLVNGLVMVGAILTNKSAVTLDMVTPIARLTGEYEVLVVPKDSPIQSLADLIAQFKAEPGKVAWGGGSAGGTDHIIAGLIANASGVDPASLNYVPFSGGGEALAAILGGHVTAGISGIGEWLGQIQAGELRALGVTSPERLPGVDIPTLKEQGVDVVLANWRAVVAPPELEDADKAALLAAVDATVKSDPWKKVLADKGWMDLYLAGDDFAAFLTEENARVGETLKKIGLVQ